MKIFLKNGWFIFGSIFVIFIGYFLILGFDPKEVISSSVGDKGTFGDSFGFLTALFSALAFGAFIITLWQQQEELELTREELRKSADALKEQSINLQKQNFENTFFNLLKLHNDITDKIDPLLSNNSSLYKYKSNGQDNMGGYLGQIRLKRELNRYLFFYNENSSKIGHYFRNIYQILKFVKYSNIENKKFYTNILRAQFSTIELEYLLFHCLSDYGKDKFQPLIEEFEFLEPLFLDKNYLFEEIDAYDIRVFGQNSHTLKIIKELRIVSNK